MALNQLVRYFLSEFLGTLIFVTLGLGSVVSSTLRIAAANGVVNDNSVAPLTIALGFGFGAVVAIAVAGPVTGGHINPAVTLAYWSVYRHKFPLMNVAVYMAGQYLGAFLSAGLVYGVYHQGLSQLMTNFVNNSQKAEFLGGVFSSYPEKYVGIGVVYLDQILCAALLMIGILAFIDKRGLNMPPPLQPFAIGGTISVIIICFGINCDAALNPARDLAPRIFSVCLGYGWDAFSKLDELYWWSGGVLAPHLGALLGAWLYQTMVGLHHSRGAQLELSENGIGGKKHNSSSTISDEIAFEKGTVTTLDFS